MYMEYLRVWRALCIAVFCAGCAWGEDAPKNDWPKPFECPRYSVSVPSLTLHHAEKSSSKYKIFLYLTFRDLANDDKLGAVQIVSETMSGVTDAGPLTLVPEYQSVTPMYKRAGGM